MREISISLGQVLSVGPSGVHQRYLQRNLHGSQRSKVGAIPIFEALTEYQKTLSDSFGGSEYGHTWTNLRMPQCQ